MNKRTPSQAARQIASELGQSSPKGTARLACALSGTKPVATLVNTRMEVPSPSRGRPSYRWVDACYVVRPDGMKEYPPVRIREAWSRCASEGWAFKVVSESEYKPESKPKDEPERITTKARAATYRKTAESFRLEAKTGRGHCACCNKPFSVHTRHSHYINTVQDKHADRE